MFDTDSMEILNAYEELGLLFDSLNKVKTYGVDINLSLVKADYDDYQCGLNIRIGNHLGQEYEATSKVNGENLSDVLLTAFQEMADEFQKQADAEEEAKKKATTTDVIDSLKTNNMLLERRVEELYKLLEEERNKNSQMKKEYKDQTNTELYTLLSKIANKYYNQ